MTCKGEFIRLTNLSELVQPYLLILLMLSVLYLLCYFTQATEEPRMYLHPCHLVLKSSILYSRDLSIYGRRSPRCRSICLLPFPPADTRMMLSTIASSSTATDSARPLERRKLDGGKEEKYKPRALRVIRKDVMKCINPYSPLSTCT